MPSSARVLIVPLLGLSLALGGCAVVRPPVQAVSTGWPEPKPDAHRAAESAQASAAAQRSASAPRVSDSAPATRATASAQPTSARTGGIVTHTPSSTTSPAGAFVGRGVRVPVPAGYDDKLGTQTPQPSGGAAQVVALLANQAAHSISVETLPTTETSLNGYVDAYVAQEAAKAEVMSRSIKTVAGQAGVRLMLRYRASGDVSVVYVTLKDPGVILRIDAAADTPAQAEAAAFVSTNIQL